MPAVSERQRRFMGAELSRHRRGKKTRTGMSESKLEDFASKSMGDVMEKNVVKAISKYLRKQQRHPDPHGPDAGKRPSGQGLTGPPGKPSMRNPYPATQEESTSAKKRLGPAMDPAGYSVDKQEPNEDFKTALDAFSTKPKTPKEAGVAAEDRRKYDEAAAKITPPKRVIAKENDYPPTKGERRSAKRQKAKEMRVTGAGTKNLQRIIGQKATAAGGVDKQASEGNKQEEPVIKAITSYMKDGKYTHEEAKAAFDRDAAKVMGARQQKRDAELRRERGLAKQDTGRNEKYREKPIIKAISAYLKEDTPRYNKKAVDAEIKRDKRIGGKEAKAIHGLLRGRKRSTDIDKGIVSGSCGGAAATSSTSSTATNPSMGDYDMDYIP